MILNTKQDDLYELMGRQFDIINARTLRLVKVWHQSNGVGMAIDEATQTFYGSNYQGAVWTANLDTLKVDPHQIGVGHGGCYNNRCAGGQPSGTDGITLDTTNGLLYAANTNDGDIAVVNTKTRKTVSLIEPGLGEGTFAPCAARSMSARAWSPWRADPPPPARPPGRATIPAGRPVIERRRRALRGFRTDSVERVERALTRHGHRSMVPKIREDLDQSLGVLVRAGARGVRRFQLCIVEVRRGERGLVAGWAKPQMNDVRTEPRMADEGRMELNGQVRTRNHVVQRQNVRSGPGVRRLADGGHAAKRQIEIDLWSREHAWHGTATHRQLVDDPRRCPLQTVGREMP